MEQPQLPRVVADVTLEERRALEIYEEEIARGLLHSEDWKDQMAAIKVKLVKVEVTYQDAFVAWMKRNGFKQQKNGGWIIE